MPKNQKQKTNVKKNNPVASKKRKNKPLSNQTAPQTAIAGSSTAVSQINSVGTNETELKMEDFANLSEERAGIISIVKGLEGQVETAFELKEVLETELDAAQNRLSEQLEARAQLELQVKSFESQSPLAEQLREDICLAEEERNKFANSLAQTQPQFEQATAERNCLTEQMVSAEAAVEELKGEKMALEAQVMNLKDKITDAGRLRKKLAEITGNHRDLRQQVHDLTRRLEASNVSKDALEKKLAGTRRNSQTLREEAEELREKVTGADSRTADLRIQLKDRQATNQQLMKTNTHLENETKMVNINYKAAENELDAFKNALHNIRSEVTQTSGRVRQRYFKPNNAGNSN